MTLSIKEYMVYILFVAAVLTGAAFLVGTRATNMAEHAVFAVTMFALFLVIVFTSIINFWPEVLIMPVSQYDLDQYENDEYYYEEGFAEYGSVLEPAPAQSEWDHENPRDITAAKNSPYISPVSNPEPIIVDGKPANLYQMDDIIFDFEKRPHTLLIGESGSGKTVTLFNILNLIKDQYRSVKFVVIDYGNQDFEQTYPTDLNTFLKTVEYMFYIMKGRQQEGRDVPKQRIIWVVEEFESVLGEIKILPKAEQDAFTMRLANIGRMARKLALNMIFVTQSALASDFPTSIRNNFGNRVIMRLANNKLVNSFGCSYRVDNLPTGYGWMSTIDDFITFPMAKEPTMDIIPYNDLRRLAVNYKKTYNLTLDEELLGG